MSGEGTLESLGRGAVLPSIELTFGGRSSTLDFHGLHMSGQGVELRSRWPFEVGTDLAIEFDAADPDEEAGGGVRVEGIVVGCDMIPETCGCYKVTLLFMDLPLADRLRLNGISRIIARSCGE